MFTIEKSCPKTSARSGYINTAHGGIKTPVFMPIGTYAAIKTLSTDEIKTLGFSLVLSNTYHLYLRPGVKILDQFKGLHNFMDWDGAILTDSGGYQIYSLSNFRKISEDGVEFKSHLDGSKHYFTPEKIIDIQRSIGSDIMMVLDVCPPADATYQQHCNAINITTKWATRCLKQFNRNQSRYGYNQIIAPIIQGGTSKKLRKLSSKQLIDLNFSMYAIGGLAVGEPKPEMLKIVHYLDELIPKNKPRYLMGVGTPSDLIKCISFGVDMFDCVIPTRNGRNGQLFTKFGKLNIRNAKYKDDKSPIDINNNNPISQNYTKAYLHHLFKTEEILGYRLATQHNLSFYNNLVLDAREAILHDKFEKWSNNFLNSYNQ